LGDTGNSFFGYSYSDLKRIKETGNDPIRRVKEEAETNVIGRRRSGRLRTGCGLKKKSRFHGGVRKQLRSRKLTKEIWREKKARRE